MTSDGSTVLSSPEPVGPPDGRPEQKLGREQRQEETAA